jgi:hypothetical protein
MPFAVDLAFVRRAESRLGMDLPASYVATILEEKRGKRRRGRRLWEVHPVFDDSDTVRLKRTCNDVVHETSEARDWEDFPPNAVSIAANGVGDHLILLPDSSNAKCLGETVYRWDHETGAIVPVADAFARLR